MRALRWVPLCLNLGLIGYAIVVSALFARGFYVLYWRDTLVAWIGTAELTFMADAVAAALLGARGRLLNVTVASSVLGVVCGPIVWDALQRS